jgi:hypothetical protein
LPIELIADCQLQGKSNELSVKLIITAVCSSTLALAAQIGNRQSAITKVPRQAARDFKVSEVVRVRFPTFPSCLAGYFTWPQVALTHHVFHRAYTLVESVASSTDEADPQISTDYTDYELGSHVDLAVSVLESEDQTFTLAD